jgi:hypothetical protein
MSSGSVVLQSSTSNQVLVEIVLLVFVDVVNRYPGGQDSVIVSFSN